MAKGMDTFGGVLKANQEDWREVNKTAKPFKRTGAKVANTLRKVTSGMRGFRMEALGVMFFGMGMAKFFEGVLAPALKLVGVFQLWNTTLAVGFLPIALRILPLLLQFMDWFLNLPEAVQTASD